MTRPNRGSDAFAEAAVSGLLLNPAGREPVAENGRFAERRLKGSKPEATRQKGATHAFLLSMFGRESNKTEVRAKGRFGRSEIIYDRWTYRSEAPRCTF
jgi:hypothetical protein